MSHKVRIYLALLLTIVVSWAWARVPALRGLVRDANCWGLFGVTGLYLCSHFFRMLRLALLTLDRRDKAFPLIAAHALTAFPSSFLPFKIGEVLRLSAFFHVFECRQKALAVWLAERFGDVLVITAFILGLYLFNVSVPAAMRMVFAVFVSISAVGLVGLFAVAKTFVYLNRHLVLSSSSARGLVLLRASHQMRSLEAAIYRSVEGRVSGFLLLSVLIWGGEISALSLFISLFSISGADFAALFASGLLASLPGGGTGAAAFGLYQSLALVMLTLIFLLFVWLGARYNILRG